MPQAVNKLFPIELCMQVLVGPHQAILLFSSPPFHPPSSLPFCPTLGMPGQTIHACTGELSFSVLRLPCAPSSFGSTFRTGCCCSMLPCSLGRSRRSWTTATRWIQQRQECSPCPLPSSLLSPLSLPSLPARSFVLDLPCSPSPVPGVVTRVQAYQQAQDGRTAHLLWCMFLRIPIQVTAHPPPALSSFSVPSHCIILSTQALSFPPLPTSLRQRLC